MVASESTYVVSNSIRPEESYVVLPVVLGTSFIVSIFRPYRSNTLKAYDRLTSPQYLKAQVAGLLASRPDRFRSPSVNSAHNRYETGANEKLTVIAVFQDHNAAESAVKNLAEAGFKMKNLSA